MQRQKLPYVGQAVLVVMEDEAIFGHVANIHGHDIHIKGESSDQHFQVHSPMSNPAILYIKIDPYAVPQLLDMALATGNEEDFMTYTAFLKEWSEVLEELPVPLLGYTHDNNRKVVIG